MSKNENPKIVLKKGVFSGPSDHNDLNFSFKCENVVMLNFQNN
jgi:hypothetical protein